MGEGGQDTGSAPLSRSGRGAGGEGERENKLRQIREKAQRMLNAGKPEGQPTREPFHWALEFPEVFLEKDAPKGFSAIVGNPPFMGGLKLFDQFGREYRDFVIDKVANGVRGNRGTADLCSYFFLEAQRISKKNGHYGLVATNTIAQGDTRRIGLDQQFENGCQIYRAIPSRPWPGTAAIEVAYVWERFGTWRGDFTLNNSSVEGITPYLTVPGKTQKNPERLALNKNIGFIGSYVLGIGFVLEQQESESLLAKNSKNKDVIFPSLFKWTGPQY